MNNRLKDKTVLITQCGDYMGPAVNDLFTNEGARVIAREGVVPNEIEKFNDYVRDCRLNCLLHGTGRSKCLCSGRRVGNKRMTGVELSEPPDN